ncbi:MAG: LysM peptidoglycan-binding domain-containing protein [Clostridiales Family XIII bacterium]|jgi:hypothetical protein|nr:LysM peptidoglycan-binding domain-containing protein [Clostridiales Family XIII bacterium]
MNTFIIAGKRYRIRSKTRFLTFITAMLVTAAIIGATVFGGGVSGTEKQEYRDITVRPGDTLWSIAREHRPEGTPIRRYVSEIKAANGLGSEVIYPGQTISVYGP